MISMQGNHSVSKIDPVQLWLDTLSFSQSGSQKTARVYTDYFKDFCTFITEEPLEILKEYEKSKDRDFRRKYARLLKVWIGHLRRQGYARNSVRVKVMAVKSFFKYSDLPLSFVPMSKAWVEYHNRDITKDEITEVISISGPREKAFFAVMAQSGLRPHSLCELRIKHLQPDFKDERIPCRIIVPRELAKGKYHGYFTFIGAEAVTYLKTYLKTRTKLSSESYIFAQHGHEIPINHTNSSNLFRRALLKLKEKGVIDYNQKAKGKPSQLRLYNLRKWFRKQAHDVGFEVVQFWMGHTVNAGQEEHYRPTNIEWHRQLYADKAMPYLRIEAATPVETEKTIRALKEELRVTKLAMKLHAQETGEKIQRLESMINEFVKKETQEKDEELIGEYEEKPEAFEEETPKNDKES